MNRIAYLMIVACRFLTQNILLQNRCANGGNCISVSKVCNFYSDCPGGSDEMNCPATCNFQNSFCKWQNAKSVDHYDWVRNKGQTPSRFTGPSVDHTTNSSAGKSRIHQGFLSMIQ